MEKNVYPVNFHRLFRKHSTAKQRNRKSNKSKDKPCKRFCKEVFLPEKERVEMAFSNRNKRAYITPSRFAKSLYLKSCHDIYCQQPKCPGNKKRWVKSFTKKRKARLMEQGAVSGCRDLHKEFPEYYKNI